MHRLRRIIKCRRLWHKSRMANASLLANFITMIRPSFFFVLVLSGLLTCSGRPALSQKVLIAAASDLKFALDSIVTAYKQTNPRGTVQVTYGSSGKFYEQVKRGAPFDMFFSADLDYPQRLRQQDHCIGDVVNYGEGRLVVWSLRKDIEVESMQTLADPRVRKVAIANPLHAPYGKRAVQALVHSKLYDTVEPKLVYGENISQTAQFLTTGAADADIIALSLALSPTMKRYGRTFYLVPRDSHQSLEQGYVILRHAEGNSAVKEFASFFQGERSREILMYFGFLNTQ